MTPKPLPPHPFLRAKSIKHYITHHVHIPSKYDHTEDPLGSNELSMSVNIPNYFYLLTFHSSGTVHCLLLVVILKIVCY